MRSASNQPWYADIKARLRFERHVRDAFPSINVNSTGRGMKAQVRYALTVDVPEYPPRRVMIAVPNWSTPIIATVTADGPTESPHRYGPHELCIWHPNAPPAERWLPEDGLLALIDHARVHLFKEAYWRETGRWPGPEAPHEEEK